VFVAPVMLFYIHNQHPLLTDTHLLQGTININVSEIFVVQLKCHSII